MNPAAVPPIADDPARYPTGFDGALEGLDVASVVRPPESAPMPMIREQARPSFEPASETATGGPGRPGSGGPATWIERRDEVAETVLRCPEAGPTNLASGRWDDTSTPPRPNLSSVAASYLRLRRDLGDILADGWDLSPEGLSEPGQLFAELHRRAPVEAERLARGVVSLPEPGDRFLDFHLISELGRGAFGRVFLAHQGDLANRVVALKVSTELPGESSTLAQLQHTNIVPIFSSHQAPPLHAVCMPYFGRATLSDLIEDVASHVALPNSGQILLRTLGSRRSSLGPGSTGNSKASKSKFEDAPGAVRPDSAVEPDQDAPEATATPVAAPESEMLRTIGKLSYVGAILWIVVRIADGLAHAHDRGILHRDLKPANILLTDDGQPMILDFNLSEDIKPGSDATVASIGGTLPYMSPEHMERFLGGETAPDARSDIYALGLVFFEMLTARPAFDAYPGHSVETIRRMIQERKDGAPSARTFNPAISPAVEAILRRCLEPDPAGRYQSAADLREDLERHLADLPLKHTREPSVRERAAKWVRRHPRIGSSTTILTVSAALVIGLASALVARSQRLARLEATNALARFFDEATSIRFLLNHRTDDRARRARGEALAREALGRFGVLDDPAWKARPAVAQLAPEDRARLRDEVAEVLLMLSQARALDAADRPEPADRRKLGESARNLGKLALASMPAGREPRAFWAQQAALARLLGDEKDGARLAAEAEKLPLRTPRDYYLAATGLALRGDHAKALPLAEESTRMDPRDFWSWFVLGVCQDRMEHHPEAMACFTTCIALRPDFADSWFNRALAYLKRGDLDRARADFDRAARLRPDWYEPPLNRALAYRELGEHRRAENDLTRSLELGAPETRVYFLRAAEREKLGDAEGARRDLQDGLKRVPTDVPSWISRGNARMATDPEGALADYAAALKSEPRSLQALQMSAYILSDLPGREEDTIRMLDRAVEAHPDFVPVRSGRGVQLALLGRRDEALRDARESLWRDTSPAILYQVAGIYATTAKTHPEDKIEAYRLLAAALRAGFGFELMAEDRELDAIRNEPEFHALVESARAQAKERLPRPSGR